VDLLKEDKSVAWTKKAAFGEVRDRAFKAAFAMPQHFSAYAPAFEGILQPGVKVPFPPKWQDIETDYADAIRYVRVSILSYWALGGGINEIQVYPKE